MANISHAIHNSFYDRVGDFFMSLLKAMDLAGSANARFREMEHLNTRSDAQLEKMGLRREEIAQHVFRDIYYAKAA
ncbi:hypothetical protein BCF46_2495 [Litoreibacter meonggei]|uniref:DUF1127 domain-containing protein n=1 Tax=Litoreibacter meonggei TaxID=1049199 RepID=A0A497VRA6_9RHOB|nr:hypothetical protein [Litoreibacter meonggei]RLJ41536.1 hypothetical protein BCF46_2495 [Litoreibacter meonggei]